MIAIGNRTLQEIADALGGVVTGDPATEVRSVATLETASSGDLVFLFDARRDAAACATRASAIVVGRGASAPRMPSVAVANPKVAFATILERFGTPSRESRGVHPSAVIDPTARLGAGVDVGPLAVVGPRAAIGAGSVIGARAHVGIDVEIGEACRLAPGAAVLDRCRLGDRVVLHANAVVGSVGFNLVNDGKRATRLPHAAAVRVGDDVEIGACSCIDRGVLEDTVIENGVKIDNLVQIAHNVKLGEGTVVCAQVGISGSTVVEPGCVFGGQAGTIGHLKIGARAQIAAGSAVWKNVAAGSTVMGHPARPAREFLRMTAESRGGSRDKITKLEKRIAELEARLKPAPPARAAARPRVRSRSSR